MKQHLKQIKIENSLNIYINSINVYCIFDQETLKNIFIILLFTDPKLLNFLNE